jgi:hypothetical protein
MVGALISGAIFRALVGGGLGIKYHRHPFLLHMVATVLAGFAKYGERFGSWIYMAEVLARMEDMLWSHGLAYNQGLG